VKRIALVAAWLAAVAAPVLAQDNPNLGRDLAATCANCHGTGGVSAGGNESLAGKRKEDLLKALQDFKSGAKPATIMHQLAKGFSDSQLEAIAAWFAAQKPAK
jgi:cytochrome c553